MILNGYAIKLTESLTGLPNLIGKKIFDIGYLIWSPSNDREDEKKFQKHQNNSIQFCFYGGAILIFDDDTNLTVWNPRPARYDMFVDFNFSIEEYKRKELERNKNPGYFHLFSVRLDPDMSNEYMNSLLGKKIVSVELARYKNKKKNRPPLKIPDRFGSIIFGFDDGTKTALGHSMQSEIATGLEFHPSDYVLPEVIDEIISIPLPQAQGE